MNFTTKELARLMLDNAKGKVVMPANFSEGEVRTPNEAITDAFLQVMQLDKNAKVEDIQLAFRKEEVRLGVFAIVEEVIRESIIAEAWHAPFFDRFVETKSQTRGDKTVFYVESRNEVVVSRVSKDGRVALDRQRFDEGEEVTVKTATYAVKVYEHLARILLGRSDWGKFVMALQEAVQKDMTLRCYDAFAKALTQVPAAFKHTGSYNEAAIKKAIRNVKLAAGATSVTLVGTELALAKLQGADYPQTDDIKNELHQTGRLGYWYGVELMELPQAIKQGKFNTTNLDSAMLLNDQHIYIIPNNVGRPVKQIVEPELLDINESGVRVDDTIEFAVRYTQGVTVIVTPILGLIDINA